MDQTAAGLAWVGDRFYTPDSFNAEAAALGISKRIAVVPKWLKVGRTWVYLAHPAAITKPCECDGSGIVTTPCEKCDGSGIVKTPAVFRAFVPRRITRIVGDDMPEVERGTLRGQGFHLVVVPHDDPDHQPSGKKAKLDDVEPEPALFEDE